MISSTSLRSPQKTCGLFDTGFAGGAHDVTSQDSNDISDLFSDSATYSIDNPGTSKLDLGNDNFLMDSWDLLDPLGDLEADHLGNDSLDAFINLDTILAGENLFDVTAEVSPVIDISPGNMKQAIGEMSIQTSSTETANTTVVKEIPLLTSRKRKLSNTKTKETVLKTSMFEIPARLEKKVAAVDTQLDHDYTAKLLKLSQDNTSTSQFNNLSHDSEYSSSSITQGQECGITDKQAVRRMKNNVASKRSREQRKQKFVEMDQEAEDLIVANETLRKKIVELEKLAQEMKAQLVAKMSGK
ncbi:hypothetical protein BgiMline_026885 [Biomphalaria glabrata]|uniref:Uncharacterized protein LOC106070583 n=2 Tax=Biomphalaria glabrata TaxID=6526 RepID=A0A9W2YBQ9_BIOGL|nr:uncharacterized protein LOC106070583 [Biomphalaria glabrata]KAI8744328.1 CAunnamed protein product [Biomphalaria glabrata]